MAAHRVTMVAVGFVLALVWRIWLGTHYAGWEESDYGTWR